MDWLRLIRRRRSVALRQFKYVFIVTYGRSGSTLIQSLLNSMPKVHLSGENGNALNQLYQSYKMVRRARAKFSHYKEFDEPWYGADRLRPRSYARALAQVFVREVIRPPVTAEWVGFKEIRYFDDDVDFEGLLDFMSLAFPGAKFVFNRRTDAAIADSAWYRARDRTELHDTLRRWDDMMDAYKAAHTENCLVIDYADYTANHADLERLFAFLGRPYDAALVARTMAKKLTHSKTT